MSISEIAEALKKSAANISRTVTDLKDNTLIVSHETRGERKAGKPKKICSLTSKAQQIVKVFEETPKHGLTEDQVSALITLMEDETLSVKTREVAAGTLSEHANSISDSLLRKQKIRKMFKQAVSSYPVGEENRKSILSILSAALPYIIQNQETAKWFHENLYDDFPRIIQDPKVPQYLRNFAIETLSRTAGLGHDPNATSKTIDTLLCLCFKNEALSKTIENELMNFEAQFQIQIIEKIRDYAQNQGQKENAEDLLQVLIRNWWGKNLSRST